MALVTLARIKESLPGVGSTYDTVLNSLITEVSDYLVEQLGRELEEATFTEYHDGGGDRIYLRQGPIVSVTTLSTVVYSVSGGSRVETLTTVAKDQYLERETRAEGSRQCGVLEAVSSPFTEGQRNYKVVYVAGYSALPAAVTYAACRAVVAAFNAREAVGLESRTVGDGAMQPVSYADALDGAMRELAPWRKI